jgi:integrase
MTVLKLSKRAVDTAKADRDTFYWDSVLTGFGLKVTVTGRKVYVCQYRVGGGRRGLSRRYTIGVHGSPWTLDQARTEAKRVLGLAASGNDPAALRQLGRAALTVGELCDLYLAEGCATKKASTIATDLGRIERHIKPLLGRTRVVDVSRADIERFLRDVAEGRTKADVRTRPRGRAIVDGGRGTATRTVGLLGGMFSFAVARGMRADNPIRGVKRFPDRKSERFLSPAELAKLGEALSSLELEGTNTMALSIIRLLALTGARKSEIAKLKWGEVDLEHARLRLNDSKSGQKSISLGAPAVQMLGALERPDDSQFVFPSVSGQQAFQGVDKVWREVRRRAGFPQLRLHDLRHSYVSMGLAAGDALPVIGALLGHSDVKTTARYAHLADDPVKAAANRISGLIATAMSGTTNADNLVAMRRRR